jgi:hypothetical protein
MRIEIDDWLTAIVFILIVLGILFSMMYLAARLAVIDAPNVPKFSCLPEQDGDTTRFTLMNTGTGTAFDVAVRLASNTRGEPVARTPIFGPGMTTTWTLSRAIPDPAQAPVSPSGDAPAADQVVQWLTVEWRVDPSGSRHWTRIPVRIAKGLIAR